MSNSQALVEGPALSFSRDDFRVRHLFPTPVLIAPVNEATALNRALSETILERSKDRLGVTRSNRGGWQSEDDFETWGGEAGVTLLQGARALASGFTGIQGEGAMSVGAPELRMNAWANVNFGQDSNVLHHHAGSFWSGVYWVDAGESDGVDPGGQFEVSDPRGILPTFYAPNLRFAISGHLSAGASEFITPQTGALILFPSWLQHAVRPYTGARPRISVAFNLSV